MPAQTCQQRPARPEGGCLSASARLAKSKNRAAAGGGKLAKTSPSRSFQTDFRVNPGSGQIWQPKLRARYQSDSFGKTPCPRSPTLIIGHLVSIETIIRPDRLTGVQLRT